MTNGTNCREVTLGQPRQTSAFVCGQGGTPIIVSCPSGRIGVGITVDAANGVPQGFGFVCAPVSFDGHKIVVEPDTYLNPVLYRTKIVSYGASPSFGDALCPSQSVLVGVIAKCAILNFTWGSARVVSEVKGACLPVDAVFQRQDPRTTTSFTSIRGKASLNDTENVAFVDSGEFLGGAVGYVGSLFDGAALIAIPISTSP